MLFLNAASVFSPLNKSCVDGIDVGVHCTSNKENSGAVYVSSTRVGHSSSRSTYCGSVPLSRLIIHGSLLTSAHHL